MGIPRKDRCRKAPSPVWVLSRWLRKGELRWLRLWGRRLGKEAGDATQQTQGAR